MFTQNTCSAGNFALVSVFLCYFIFVQKLELLGQKFKEFLVNLPRFTVSGFFFYIFCYNLERSSFVSVLDTAMAREPSFYQESYSGFIAG